MASKHEQKLSHKHRLQSSWRPWSRNLGNQIPEVDSQQILQLKFDDGATAILAFTDIPTDWWLLSNREKPTGGQFITYWRLDEVDKVAIRAYFHISCCYTCPSCDKEHYNLTAYGKQKQNGKPNGKPKFETIAEYAQCFIDKEVICNRCGQSLIIADMGYR